METNTELGTIGFLYYQELIGILIWEVDLVHFNLLLEVSLLYNYLDAPREVHLGHLVHIVGF